jgi:hypothetical protein
MSNDKAKLPDSCAVCVYFVPLLPDSGRVSRTTGTCIRHAPSVGDDQYSLVHWPIVVRTDRCGVGAAAGDGTGPQPTRCNSCLHWFQPSGEAVTPDYRKGRSADFWLQTGFCTRFAPSPSAEEAKRMYPAVTHALEKCGDGQGFASDDQA